MTTATHAIKKKTSPANAADAQGTKWLVVTAINCSFATACSKFVASDRNQLIMHLRSAKNSRQCHHVLEA